jgi:hypothetical protein
MEGLNTIGPIAYFGATKNSMNTGIKTTIIAFPLDSLCTFSKITMLTTILHKETKKLRMFPKKEIITKGPNQLKI